MLLDNDQNMIFLTEIIQFKKFVCIVNDRNIKFIIQCFLIETFAGSMSVCRHPENHFLTVRFFQQLLLKLVCLFASSEHHIITRVSKREKFLGSTSKEFHLCFNKDISGNQTIIKEYLTSIFICLISASMPEINKELISS